MKITSLKLRLFETLCLTPSLNMFRFRLFSNSWKNNTDIWINTYISDIQTSSMVIVHVWRLNTCIFCLIFSFLSISIHLSFPVEGSTMLALWCTFSSELVMSLNKIWGKESVIFLKGIKTYIKYWFRIYSQRQTFWFLLILEVFWI